MAVFSLYRRPQGGGALSAQLTFQEPCTVDQLTHQFPVRLWHAARPEVQLSDLASDTRKLVSDGVNGSGRADATEILPASFVRTSHS
jgi:hypothetical protein